MKSKSAVPPGQSPTHRMADALRWARIATCAAIGLRASGEPKGADGAAESLRTLRVARRSAVKARTQAANQLRTRCSRPPPSG